MFKTTVKLLSAAVIGAGAMGAQAGVISSSSSFSFGSYALYDHEIGYGNNAVSSHQDSQQLLLSGFNSSLGVLTGVSLSFNSNWSLTSSVSASTGNWFSDTKGNAQATSLLTIDMLNPNGPEKNSYQIEASSCYDSGLFGASCSDSDTSHGHFNGNLALGSVDLAGFLDTTIVMDLTRLLTAEVTKCDYDSNCYGWNTNNGWNGTLTISYLFDEMPASVPEPGMLSLFGLGLIGLGFSRRRINRQ